MLGPAVWIVALLTQAGHDVPVSAPPRSLDPRLVFEQVAREPQIVTPTGLAVDARGRVLVIESHTHFRPKDYAGPPADRIRLFEDADGDGRSERVSTFFEGTKLTMSLAFARDGSLFVATRSALYRLADRDGDGKADGVSATRLPGPIVRLDTPADYPHNGLSGFAFDVADNVYFALGENLGADYRLIGSDGTTLCGGGEGGNIYRCRPDGSKLERIATGFWNPFGLAFDKFGRLFAVDNDPDSRPPCRLLHIVEGGDYGYRFRNGRKGVHPFTAWNGELPGTLPMVAGTGEAPCGVLSYEADNLPPEYRGSLLVTSWGDHRIERYRLESRRASFGAVMEPVVIGGEDFRPVGIALAPDGSLYFSDWVDKSYELHGKGRVWRLRNQKRASNPSSTVAQKIAAEPIVLLGPKHAGPERSGKALQDASANLRALAAADVSPLVRAGALRRLADPAAKEVLLKALEADDPFLQQAAREGLKRSLPFTEIMELAGDPVPAHRLGALLIMRDSSRPDTRALVPKFLEDADPTIRFAAIQWVGEQRLADYRPQLLRGLSSGNTTREVFEGTLAALEMLDAKKRSPREELSGDDYIAALLTDPGTPDAAIRRGLRLLRPDHPVLSVDRIGRLIASPDESIRLEAVRTLGVGPLQERFAMLGRIADDPRASLPLRAWAVAGLADDAAAQRKRLLALSGSGQPQLRREAIRSLRGVSLTGPERTALTAASRGDEQSLSLLKSLQSYSSRTLGDAGSPVDASLPPKTNLEAWLTRLEGPADAAAGERVFFHSKGPGCYRCHQVDGRGGRVGPDLSRLAKGMDRRRLVQSILQPSLEIAPQFVAWSVARTDGTVFTGVLVGESPEGKLSFADSEGRLLDVKPSEIEERNPQATSIMPDNVAQALTMQEFRDLVAFLLASRQ